MDRNRAAREKNTSRSPISPNKKGLKKNFSEIQFVRKHVMKARPQASMIALRYDIKQSSVMAGKRKRSNSLMALNYLPSFAELSSESRLRCRSQRASVTVIEQDHVADKITAGEGRNIKTPSPIIIDRKLS